MRDNGPRLWLSQPIDGLPKPWNYFQIDGLMINAYEILKNSNVYKNILNTNVKKYLNINDLVTMDSGGYQFMKKEILNVDPIKILELYETTHPDFGVILDHPIMPNLNNNEIRKRQMLSLKNTEIMLNSKKGDNPILIPVIHGHNIDSIEWYINQLNKMGDFDIFGIGSLVPSVFNSKGIGGIYNVLQILQFVRKKIGEEKKIHVFGIGGTLTMHLMFYAGANSVDSSGWRVKAAYGAIQLPGIGDRYITPRKRHKNYKDLTRQDIMILDKCECPFCKIGNHKQLRSNYYKRAIHNAWVYQKEVEKARKLIANNEYKKYVHQILDLNNLFKKTLVYYDEILN